MRDPAEKDEKAGRWPAFFVVAALTVAAPSMAAAERPFASVPLTFGDLVDFDRKLVEIEGIPLAPGLPARSLCLVAAVRLSPNAPLQPPRRDMSRLRYAQFGGVWRPTPQMTEGPVGKDILAICNPYMRGDGLDERIVAALAEPGSFYIRDWTGSLFQIYSPVQRIAVTVRIAQR